MCGVYDMFLSRRTDTEVVFSGKVFFIIIEKLEVKYNIIRREKDCRDGKILKDLEFYFIIK